MFEKEAKERAEKLEEKQTLGIYDNDEDLARDESFNEGQVVGYEEGFKDGAEFAYNKANEWHYPSKGEYPKEDKRYLCRIKTFVGGGISYECFDYDTEYSSWEDVSGEVIAWKEIVLPKESE